MFAHTTDRDWQTFGDTDPYWAVLTDERFRSDQLNSDRIDEFYASGQRYVDLLFDIIHCHVDANFAPHSVLDFGCGVGRITLPLAHQCNRVVGVDISEGMLAKARQRSTEVGLNQVDFVYSDDQLLNVDGPFDFVHSYIVLQHIPPVRGEAIFRRLVELVTEGGVAALHVTYGRPSLRACSLTSRVRTIAGAVLDRFRPLLRHWLRPKMQMNVYDLNQLVGWIQKAGGRRLHIELTDHGGCAGAMLIFQRQPTETFAI